MIYNHNNHNDNSNETIPWKSKTKQRMVFRMIHAKDSLLPMGKVWSLDFLGIMMIMTMIYNDSKFTARLLRLPRNTKPVRLLIISFVLQLTPRCRDAPGNRSQASKNLKMRYGPSLFSTFHLEPWKRIQDQKS